MIGFVVKSGDLDTSDGLQLVSGVEYARQKIRQRLQLFLGEWFLDTRLGVPWFESILVKSPDLKFVQGTLRNVISAVPGVTSVQTVEAAFDRSSRSLTIVYRVAYEGATLVEDVVTTPVQA